MTHTTAIPKDPDGDSVAAEKWIIVAFRDGSAEKKFTGSSVRYSISPKEATGCVKVFYMNGETHIFPLDVVRSVSMSL